MLRQAVPAVAILLVVALWLSWANDWPPTRPLKAWWARYASFVRWYVTSAPATFIYLAILGVTSWVLLGMPDGARQAYIEAQSTNLTELSRSPLRALVRSAFFVTNGELLLWMALFATLLAPVERWLGTGRAVSVFITGHVLATLLAALDIWVHVTYLAAPQSLTRALDTGASYGFLSLATLLVYRVRGRSRWVLAVVLALVVGYGLLDGAGFTARGHAAAVVIGLALRPVTRSPVVRAREGRADSVRRLWRRRDADGAPTRPVGAGASSAD